MDAHNIVDFITKLPKLMQQVPDVQALLDAMEDMDANAVTEWQATKAYSKLTGHKTVCVAKDFLPLLQNALHMVHTGKPKRTMSTAIKEDVFLMSSALEDALKRPGVAGQNALDSGDRQAIARGGARVGGACKKTQVHARGTVLRGNRANSSV